MLLRIDECCSQEAEQSGHTCTDDGGVLFLHISRRIIDQMVVCQLIAVRMVVTTLFSLAYM
jgi:hypothetical protein